MKNLKQEIKKIELTNIRESLELNKERVKFLREEIGTKIPDVMISNIAKEVGISKETIPTLKARIILAIFDTLQLDSDRDRTLGKDKELIAMHEEITKLKQEIATLAIEE